jgi:Fic family protein
LNLKEVIDYEKFSMISIVWYSTKIEGCALTELDTRILIENDLTAAGKPLKDHLMVKNHFEMFQFMEQQAQQKRKFSIALIQEMVTITIKNTGAIIHSISGTFDSSKGDLRKVPQLLEQLFEAVNDKINTVSGHDILKLAADLHYKFINIHPFADGNGRTARLLMNYIQAYHNEPYIKIFTEDRKPYIDALNETEEKSDLEFFRTFIGQQQLKFLNIEIEKYKQSKKGFMLMF